MNKTLLFLSLLIAGSISLHAQSLDLSGQVGAGVPVGDFADGWTTGFGLTVTGLYEFEPGLHLTGSLAYHSFPKETKLTITGGSYSSVPILAGVRYVVGQTEFTWYVGGETGLHFTNNTIETPNTLGGTKTTSLSETAFSIAPLGGLMYKLTDNLTLDITAKYNLVFTEVINRTFLGVNAGVIFPIK